LLELRGISKHFGAVKALTDVDFDVYPSEVVALCGDNGAGKSTLVKCVSGTHPPDAGKILFEGREVKISSPSDATRLGIETVYQDLALCDNLDVVQNMYLGREAVRRFVPFAVEPLSEFEMEKKALDVLESLRVTTIGSVRTKVASLSGGQRQSVAISKAVMWHGLGGAAGRARYRQCLQRPRSDVAAARNQVHGRGRGSARSLNSRRDLTPWS
jgi:D-xylose transport system ATP-binding protein